MDPLPNGNRPNLALKVSFEDHQPRNTLVFILDDDSNQHHDRYARVLLVS